jgi:hypothetical protein
VPQTLQLPKYGKNTLKYPAKKGDFPGMADSINQVGLFNGLKH